MKISGSNAKESLFCDFKGRVNWIFASYHLVFLKKSLKLLLVNIIVIDLSSIAITLTYYF